MPAFTTCLAVAGALNCMTSDRPPVAPAEAARILAPHQFALTPERSAGPVAFVLQSRTEDGPFGPFSAPPPPRRLDGSSYDDPPWTLFAYVGHGASRRAASPPVRRWR